MPTVEDMRVAQKLWDDAKAQAVGVAKLRGLGRDQKEYTAQDELLLWNKEADGWTPEREAALLTGVNPDGTPILDEQGQPVKPKSREEVGLLKYPHRMKMAASGERALSKYAQAKWAAQTARRADPLWQPPAPPGSAMPATPTTTTTDQPPPEAGASAISPLGG